MDPMSRKLFQSATARERLAQMGGIMASSPGLAQTVARFQVGGSVGEPTYVVIIPGVTDRRGMRVTADTLEQMGRINPQLMQQSQVMDAEVARQQGIDVGALRPGDAFLPARVAAPAPAAPAPATELEDSRSWGQRNIGDPLRQALRPVGEGVRAQMRGEVPIQPLSEALGFDRLRTPAEEIGLDPMLPPEPRPSAMADPTIFPSLDMPVEEDRAMRAVGRREMQGPPVAPVAAEPFEENFDAIGMDPFGPGMSTAPGLVFDDIGDALPPPATSAPEAPAREDGPEPTSGGPAAEEPDPLADAGAQVEQDLRTFFGIEPPAREPGSRRERVNQELELIREVFGDRTRDQARDRAMHLAMIGLAIAAGQSPNALANIAQGALAGTQAMSRAQQAQQQREDDMRVTAYERVLGEEGRAQDLSDRMRLAAYQASLRPEGGVGIRDARNPADFYQDAYIRARTEATEGAVDTGGLSPHDYATREAQQALAAAVTQFPGYGGLPVPAGDAGPAAPQAGPLPVVTSQAEYDRLPSGAEFMQNGERRRKP